MAAHSPMALANQPRATKKRAKSARVLAALMLLIAAAGASAHALGCATDDPVNFGDPECVAGRCQDLATAASSSSGGTDCMPDGGDCSVHFATDIFDAILDDNGTAKCTNAQCHGDPNNIQGDLLLVKGDALSTRKALLEYQFDKPAGPYITCGKPEDSRFLCNMLLEQGVTNKYATKCLTLMPTTIGPMVGQMPLTEAQLDLIAEWIKCGAPNN